MKGTVNKKDALSGFTLVELMVALVLGLLLTGGIVNVYLQNKQNFLQDEEVARLQENARYAINLLKRELTMAGFVANLPDAADVPAGSVGTDCVTTGSDWALDVSGDVFELINNVDNTTDLITLNGTTWTCITNTDVADETDMVSIKRTADSHTLEDGALNGGEPEDDKQWYLRSFDNDADLSWTYLDAGDTIPAADKTAGSKVDYWEYYSKIIYLRNYSRTAGDGIPTLCVAALNADAVTPDCYVEGIEDLQIEVGIDTDNDGVPNQFKAAPTAAEMAEAMAVRIYLLVRSVNTIAGYNNGKSYNLGTKNVAAKNDGFIRRVFTTTVQMRNANLPNA